MADPETEPFPSACDLKHYRSFGAERLLASLDALTSEIKGVKHEDDIESVHRMRVASRRLRASLGLFGECFDAGEVKKWNRAVRSVTRKLGEARDLDVQIEFLREFINSHDDVLSLEGLKADLQRKRSEEQPGVVSSLEKLERKGILEEMRRTLQKVRDSPRCSVPQGTMEKAFHHISVRLDELLSLQDSVHQPEAKERQHQMRIAAKRLRYTMEAFEPLYGPELKERIAIIKDIQDRLGELHDRDVWVDMLQAMGVNDAGFDALLHDRMETRIAMYGDFVTTWESLIEGGFFTELLGSVTPKATATQADGQTRLERIRSVAGDCGGDAEHSLHVAQLSLILFDRLRPLHRLGPAERDLLEYAAVLHDIGWREGQEAHHKSSFRMIMAEGRLPLEAGERVIVANVARYHRGALPAKGHKAYRALNAGERTVVDRLASILRVADALDASHASVVVSAECHRRKGGVVLLLGTTGYPDRELEKARAKKDLFERTFKRTLSFEWESS
jgi:CHAD domain-containing protein